MAIRSSLTTFGLAIVLTSMVALSARGEDARQAGPVGEPEGKERMQLHWLPIFVRGEPTANLIQMRLCRPATDDPVGVAVVNHGSPSRPSDRPTMRPSSCTAGVARYFLERQMIVAFPLRRGYGSSGTAFAEDFGACNRPRFGAAGLTSAADIGSAVRYLRSLPYVRGDRVLVVGQSAGGWGTIAYASLDQDNIAGFINVAGGRGGHNNNELNSNCRPDELIAAAGDYGKTARRPMLWLYTENDTWFNPKISGAMHAAFAKSGGQADYRLLPPWGKDGHDMFFGNNGSKTWGPLFDDYIKRVMPPG